MALSDYNTARVEDYNSMFKTNTEKIYEALDSLTYIKDYFDDWSASTVIGTEVMENYSIIINALTAYIEHANITYYNINSYVLKQKAINSLND